MEWSGWAIPQSEHSHEWPEYGLCLNINRFPYPDRRHLRTQLLAFKPEDARLYWWGHDLEAAAERTMACAFLATMPEDMLP